MEVGCIYSIKNRANGKEYIGQTRHDPRKRYCVHKSVSRGHGPSRNVGLLHRAMQKYGEAAFVLEVIESGIELKWLDVRERHWIRERVSLAPCGYNQEKGGTIGRDRGASFGVKMSHVLSGKRKSVVHRAAISRAMKIRWASADYRGHRGLPVQS